MVTNHSGESFFKIPKIKNEIKGRNAPGEVAQTKHSVH